MTLTLNVLYVLVALAIIVLVLMQRGSGAAAGSGFGAGSSGTVFGARGASNFLSKSTKWLAISFFAISLFMAWQASHGSRPLVEQDLGIMSAIPAAPADGASVPSTTPATTTPATSVPAAPIIAAPAGEASTVPQAPAAPRTGDVPAAPASSAPATTPQDD